MPEELQEITDDMGQPIDSGWHILFTATTRIHFIQLFAEWKKSCSDKILSSEGSKIAYMCTGHLLYYYDFGNCHQYSKVVLERLLNTQRLSKDINRYVRMIANDNRVVGKLLKQNVGRKVIWHHKKHKKEIKEVQNERNI